jgi:membrane dipeptidase
MVPVTRASAVHAVATPTTSLDESKVQEAQKLERSMLVADGLDPSALTEKYLEMLKAGGVSCRHESVGGLASFAKLLSFCDENSQAIVSVGTVREIKQAREQGKIAHVSGWQSADPLLGDANGRVNLQNLRADRQLGLRVAGIAYNNSNVFGGGCMDPGVPLTQQGQRYVEEVHKQRLLLDVCRHTCERTSFDGIEISKGVPVICSHTNCRALNDNPRNTSDRAIEAIAKTGGVIGLRADSDMPVRSREDANVAHMPQGSFDKELDQYDHLKNLVGVDYIGGVP